MPAKQLIESLSLTPHPEGGWYREIYRSDTKVSRQRKRRSALTQIYYLLEQDQVSRWHLINSDEIWHFYAGNALELFSYDPQAQQLERHVLGNPLDSHTSVAIIKAGHWQAARPLGNYSLLGCSVAPGFEFREFRFVSDLPEHVGHFDGVLTNLNAML